MRHQGTFFWSTLRTDRNTVIDADAAVYGVNPHMVLVGFGFYIIRLYIGLSVGPPSIGLD